jgi:hypothetical protein
MRKLMFVPFFWVLFVMTSCGGDGKKDVSKSDELKARITQMEDSLTSLSKNPETADKIPSLTHLELINRLLDYYHAFPTDTFSADCLFKVHMKFSELNVHDRSIQYGDTLLAAFPNYKNKDFVLESIAVTYDALQEPRDSAMVRKYYNLLLKESTVPKDKKADIKKRLQFNHLDFYAYIEKVNNVKLSK